jgi:VanZ family protein
MSEWNWLRRKELAVGWLLFISILFFIPGSDLPKKPWFSDIHIDKWVHVGLFTVLLFLWKAAFRKPGTSIMIMLAVLYGLFVEIFQGWLVPNRSFDLYDLLADTAGSVLGLFIWSVVYKKNKPL